MVYAQPSIFPRKWHIQTPMWLWHTHGSPNLGQKTRLNNHPHHVVPLAWISLTLSCHFSLSFIASGRVQGYIPYPRRTAVCMFKLVVLLLLVHMWGSIGVHHLWARPSFSTTVLHVFQAAVVSILLYGCTTWTLTKRLEKKLDGNYKRMLREILNKSWRQHPHKAPTIRPPAPITKTIQDLILINKKRGLAKLSTLLSWLTTE